MLSHRRARVAASAGAAAAPAAEPPSSSNASSSGVSAAAMAGTQRAARLEVLVQLRKLYRNLLRASALLEAASPVYQDPDAAESSSSNSSSEGGGNGTASSRADEEQQLRIAEAVETVAEMELTAEQLKSGMRALKASRMSFGSVLAAQAPQEAERQVEERVRETFRELLTRAAAEIAFLPFPSEAAAHAALDARNARFRGHVSWFPPADPADASAAAGSLGGGWEGGEGAAGGAGAGASLERQNSLGQRLGQAERVAEEFFGKKLSAVKKAAAAGGTSPQGVLQGIKSGARGLRDLWVRLNGGGGGSRARLPDGLPQPVCSEEGRGEEVAQLNMLLEGLEKRLQEASKARENKLRKAGIQGRARMASELRDMDDSVAALSRELAVRTLQLEMAYIYGGLEEEALDIVGDSGASSSSSAPGGGKQGTGYPLAALSRRGSSDELALLVAEFSQLDGQLGALTGLVEQGEALFIDDQEMARLATDIPDMRSRLGISDTQVFGGQGFSLVKLQLQVKEGIAKIVEGVNFGTRGVRLLVSDVGSAGRLFWRAATVSLGSEHESRLLVSEVASAGRLFRRAATGSTLKPREVQALRRTFKDLLTFVPFTVILIAPLTPVGHVLIFSFIQRYFPNLFPSQFSNKRQELMTKYEDLKRQLAEAQAQAEAENDELEFQRAAAALAAVRTRARDAVTGVVPVEEVVGKAKAAAAAGDGAPPGKAGQAAGGGAEDAEPEGPAARAVREIKENLAIAADASYTTDPEQ
ncbi:hypothetical protein N2152v2_000267 [Parachlorella kessleri]